MSKLFLLLFTLILAAGSSLVIAASSGFTNDNFVDWTVRKGDGAPERYNALTEAIGGQGYLGYICRVGGGCDLVVMIDASCSPGSEYPMLFNSDSGAYPATAICHVIHEDIDLAEYMIKDPNTVIAEAVFSDVRIGLAFPMESGKFKAVRFSLRGSQEAMARTVELSGAYRKNSGVESGEF